jgi:hypothetical protein
MPRVPGAPDAHPPARGGRPDGDLTPVTQPLVQSIWKTGAQPLGDGSSNAVPAPWVAAPRTVEDTGIRRSLLEELALKVLYLEGELNLHELASKLGVSPPVVDDIFQRLRKAQLCDVTGMVGSTHRIATNTQGKLRAQELLTRSLYAGVAPVSLADYIIRVRAQSVTEAEFDPTDVRRAFSALVLDDDTVRQVGIAVQSGTSIVLYGPSGTGKTSIAERIPAIYQGGVLIPYAVEVDGQIITVYDPGVHRRLELEMPLDADGRWVLCERPRVTAGGELTFEMLDLQFNEVTKFYTAPLQMKANNGVLVLDDFGRQRMRPEMLLNRWIVPLDRKIDFLTLQGGKKFEMPFDVLVVFSTNLDPASGFTTNPAAAAPDAVFLRRIANKIRIGHVSREQFHEVFRRVCDQYGLAYDAATVERTVDYLIGELEQPLLPCYPRDLVQQVCWEARFERRPPSLTWEAITRACRTYFILKSA